MEKISHWLCAVPDLEKGMTLAGDLFDLRWRPIRVANMTLVDANGKSSE